ncbi:MAG: transglutaminase-like cysteine peptidase [Pseudomonadota bacterium]|nr:transglutaminase-like cysteine peptidase [Pseudomonadota bacterium]
MDPALWNLKDYCARPNQFMRKTGVCEDYAISIYISLLILGFNPDHMRIVVRQDRNLKILHAVLVVYLDGQPLIPDNQIKQVVHTS